MCFQCQRDDLVGLIDGVGAFVRQVREAGEDLSRFCVLDGVQDGLRLADGQMDFDHGFFSVVGWVNEGGAGRSHPLAMRGPGRLLALAPRN